MNSERIRDCFMVGLILFVLCLAFCTRYESSTGYVYYAPHDGESFDCFNAIKAKSKWKVEKTHNSRNNAWMFKIDGIFKKSDKCTLNRYSMYGVPKGSILVYNGFGAGLEQEAVCVKNKRTNQFTAIIGNNVLNEIDYISSKYSGNICQQYDKVAEDIERGLL